ncbi:MAG: D-alanyl-D-alanine carboxypeptidase family protein [Oscillospiraceae bacterium]|nr:D-alanyl-D-alanine carboxypeptidase family protein [Oscillospiraceae bacterium]
MNNREQGRRHFAFDRAALVVIAAAIAGFWCYAGIRHLVDEPDTSAIRWSDEEVPGEEAVMDADTTTEAKDTSDDSQTINGMPIQDANIGGTSSESNHAPEGYVAIPKDEAHVHSGILVQLDGAHAYTGEAAELTNFEGKNETYRMKRMDLSTRPEVLEAMNTMGTAYMAVSGVADLMVYSTTKPYDVAGSLYPTALPDRKSGYCIDLCQLNEDGTISKFSEPHAWVKNNCWKYGFVLSYPQEDAEATGVEYAPYHLRYVGTVHAGLMHENNLTLTEYYDYLKSHDYTVPLYYTVGDTMYTVYYVEAKSGGTDVPVPESKQYEISGNNTDGFIVTVKS